MSENLTPYETMSLTINMISAYLASIKNDVTIDELQIIFKKIFLSVAEISREAVNLKNRPTLTPAVNVEDSVHNDYIICLEDGKKLQMLKRHLSTVYHMTVEEYRERWGLPTDYPVVSPSYAKRRSIIAKTTGLGSTSRKKAA